MSSEDIHKETEIQYKGVPVKSAERAVIMLHGRGSDAEDILELTDEIWLPDTCYIAPQAEGNEWYPYSFISPIMKNEPALSSAFKKLNFIFDEINESNIEDGNVYLLGFSQGACLGLEYSTRNAKKYGGIFALSGGLIGKVIDRSNYKGDFESTPIFLGCSDTDPHIPLSRVNESANVLTDMNGSVTKRIYPGMGHTIINDEITFINEILMK